MRHLVNKLYVSGNVMTMYFLYLDEDAVARVTDTVVAAALASPWTPDGLCPPP